MQCISYLVPLVCKADLHAIHHAVICEKSKVSSAVSSVEEVMVLQFTGNSNPKRWQSVRESQM